MSGPAPPTAPPGSPGTLQPRSQPAEAPFVCEGCGSDTRPATVIAAPPHEVVACRTCGLAATLPRLSAEQGAAVHGETFFGAAGGRRFRKPVEAALQLARAVRAFRVARLTPKEGVVLDVGCGRGLMLGWLASMGYRAVGTEVSTLAGVFRRPPRGLEVRLGDLPEIGFAANRFDTVAFFHSLEHVPTLGKTLAEVTRILKPGGRLLVAAPNFASLQARYGGAGWLHLDLPYHRSHFSPDTLMNALRRHGFHQDEVATRSLEYNPVAVVQTLLNLVGRPHNAFFDALRGQRRAPLDMLLGSVLAPGALLAAIAEEVAGQGGTFELVATLAPNSGR